VPSPVGALGVCPQKKNQFCAKKYAILSTFWYFIPIVQHKNFQHVASASEKVGELSPSPKSEGSIPLSRPYSDAGADPELVSRWGWSPCRVPLPFPPPPFLASLPPSLPCPFPPLPSLPYPSPHSLPFLLPSLPLPSPALEEGGPVVLPRKISKF